jgi:hypothetical protein
MSGNLSEAGRFGFRFQHETDQCPDSSCLGGLIGLSDELLMMVTARSLRAGAFGLLAVTG